jgi:hypothetical protein
VVLALNVTAVNDPSVILWRGAPLSSDAGATVVSVYEDQDVRLGDEMLYFSAAQSPAAIGHNDADAILVGAQQRTEPHRLDTPQGLQIADIDINAGALRVTLSIASGRISVDGIAPLRGLVTNQILEVSRLTIDQEMSPGQIAAAGESLVLTGDLFAINQQLKTVKYQSPLNANGYDYLIVTVSDVEDPSTTTTAVLTIRLEPVNDAPVIHLSGVPVGTLYTDADTWPVGVIVSQEDTVIPVGQHFRIEDDDFVVTNFIGDHFGQKGAGVDSKIAQYFSPSSYASDAVYVSLEVEYGTLAAAYTGTVMFFTDADEIHRLLSTGQLSPSKLLAQPPRHTRVVYAYGSYFDMQKVLESVTYLPDADWFGVDMLTIVVNDLGNIGTGGPRTLTRSIILDVRSVPDGPVIKLPQQLTAVETVEDTVGVIGSDCCGWVNGDSYGLSVINITAASVSIVDKDIYLTPRSDRAIVRSTKAFVNPTTNDPQFNTTYTDPLKQDLYVYEYDNNRHVPEANTYTVTLNVSHGVLTLPRVAEGLTFLFAAGFQDDAVVFRGPLIEVNIALRGMNYIPDQNWNSMQGGTVAAAHGISSVDTLHVHVIDGHGLESRAALTIVVHPANDPPVLSLGSLTVHNTVEDEWDQLSRTRLKVETLQCRENEKCALQDLVVRDVDVAEALDGAMQVTLTARNGTFTVDPRVSKLGRFFRSGRAARSGIMTGAEVGSGFIQVTIPDRKSTRLNSSHQI